MYDIYFFTYKSLQTKTGCTIQCFKILRTLGKKVKRNFPRTEVGKGMQVKNFK